jgi:hypothetical protein
MEARERSLGDFRAGRTSVLVVTDVAARGLDIPLLNNVVNYEFPATSKVWWYMYVYWCLSVYCLFSCSRTRVLFNSFAYSVVLLGEATGLSVVSLTCSPEYRVGGLCPVSAVMCTMYVCMHVCIYVCMYACIYVCMYACIYVCMYV